MVEHGYGAGRDDAGHMVKRDVAQKDLTFLTFRSYMSKPRPTILCVSVSGPPEPYSRFGTIPNYDPYVSRSQTHYDISNLYHTNIMLQLLV